MILCIIYCSYNGGDYKLLTNMVSVLTSFVFQIAFSILLTTLTSFWDPSGRYDFDPKYLCLSVGHFCDLCTKFNHWFC